MTLEQYAADLKQFRDERDWEKFHNIKNLTMALTTEVGELSELTQWLSEEQAKNIKNNPELLHEVCEELSDVFAYVINIANNLDIDILEQANNKLTKVKAKYPIEKAKGHATKYNKL